MRIVLLGNAGAGKSTMARRLIGPSRNIQRLSLDEIAWEEASTRSSLAKGIRELERFIERNEQWVVEGCYGDSIQAALPHCNSLRFLNPGIEVCVEHCMRRPWEPEKYASPEAQNAMLDQLIEWVRAYETREDEHGLARHRALFDGFAGRKREYVTVASYGES